VYICDTVLLWSPEIPTGPESEPVKALPPNSSDFADSLEIKATTVRY